AERAGVTDAEVATLAAESLIALHQNERVQRLLRDALTRLDHVRDPLAASRVLTTVAYDWGDDVVLVDNWAAAHRAIALASSAPCAEWAQALAAIASLHYRGHEYTRALAGAEDATRVARAVGASTAEYESQWAAARAQHELGRLPAARTALRSAVALAEQAQAPGDALSSRGELAWELLCAGRLDESCELAKKGEAAARREGLVRVANYHGEQELTVLIWRGDLAEAVRRLDGLAAQGYVEHRRRWAEVELDIAVGDLGSALALEEQTIEANHGPHLFAAGDALRQVELFEQLGNTARELGTASHLLTRLETDSPVRSAMQARCALQALCAADRTGHPVPEWLAEAAAGALATAESGLTQDWAASIYGVHLATAQAYAQRLDRQPALDEWARAAAAAERFGAYLALRPRLEHAREQLTHGQRDAGKESLIALWRSARSMGAVWFAEQAVSEARRHRVPLPASAGDAAGRRDRLTPREHDVLALLAQGATNRAIARSLYITDKTAALHVSNILAKLGVANRGEAAALARSTNEA
ncbi:MAG: helix-turn-helix transcriptional regulator, partial [Terracoccus sp.]